MNQRELLANLVERILSEVSSRRLESVASPLLSSGTFGCPVSVSAEIIVESCASFLNKNTFTSVKVIRIVTTDRNTLPILKRRLECTKLH